MTSKSKDDAKCPTVVMEERRRSPLDHLPPPANSNKPLTPFSIEDILNKPSVKRSYSIRGATAHLISSSASPGGEKLPPAAHSLSSRALLSQTSPLCALEELASKTFKGLEVSVLQAAEGKGERLLLRGIRGLFYFANSLSSLKKDYNSLVYWFIRWTNLYSRIQFVSYLCLEDKLNI